jgi:trans-2,3-dihydro-3-hydroxyanthranilate isomerase
VPELVAFAHPYEILDVFTDTPLQGNPLAVFTEGEALPSRLMQSVACEMNLSETVFLLPGDGHYDAQLRIFTPAAELPFAGHPTLGAAFVVAEQKGLENVTLLTGAGLVPVELTREHREIVYGQMDQPIPTISELHDPGALLRALGLTDSVVPIEIYVNGPEHVMVGLPSGGAVAALAPDMAALAALGDLHGLTSPTFSCFAKVAEGVFKTRVFCPGLGVPEDPATGSAAGPLALHLARHGLSELGSTIEIVQGVEINRPSKLTARVEGNAEALERIVVGGCAVRVAHGHFRLQ